MYVHADANLFIIATVLTISWLIVIFSVHFMVQWFAKDESLIAMQLWLISLYPYSDYKSENNWLE